MAHHENHHQTHHRRHIQDLHGVHVQELEKYKNLTDDEVSKLPQDVRWRVEHARLHEKHRGHEAMHAEMILILIASLAIAQVALVHWKKYYPRSYQLITLLAMWVVPIVVSLRHMWFRFVVCWLIISIITSYVIYRATRKPLPGNTARLVYKWFLLLHTASYVLGIIGYLLFMFALLGVPRLSQVWFDTSVLLLFYGLYFGVLGRDCAEICSDRMATAIGYYSSTGMPTKHLEPDMCAVCNNRLLVTNNDNAVMEKTYKLNCQHTFHEYCIRGWCIVGKKQTCPYCKEKVDMKKIVNPWERPHLLYGQLLDWIRYLVAWQPLILTAVQGINYVLGLE